MPGHWAQLFMNFLFSKKLLTFCFLFLAINSFSQKCDCDSLLNVRLSQAMKRVKNYDSFKLIGIRKKGVITTISEKEKIAKLSISDSAWVALSDYGDSVTVNFFRLGSIAGRRIYFLDGVIIDSVKRESLTHEEAMRLIITERTNQANMLQAINENVHLNDEYFEVYFNIEGRIIMSPTICLKSNCELGDFIISHFRYLR
ncbi:hypothetical protein BH11BAC3_BH11BAC3_12170 [soil metagenome]